MTHATAQRLQEIRDQLAQLSEQMEQEYGTHIGIMLARDHVDLVYEQLDIYRSAYNEAQKKKDLGVA